MPSTQNPVAQFEPVAVSSSPAAAQRSVVSNVPNITGDILLEAGTNELEVLVFKLAGTWLGVNVAKVREVIRPVRTIAAPHQHQSVIGMFNIRGNVLPVVDLAKHLGIDSRVSRRFDRNFADKTHTAPSDSAVARQPTPDKATSEEEGRVIITEFNGLRCGFLVDSVEQIHRMSWKKVRPAPNLNDLGSHDQSGVVSATTGIIELDQRLVQMVDFESVADSILLQEKLHFSSVPNDLKVDRDSKRVILAEDSPFMRTLMHKVFLASGYTKIEVCSDGQEAWEAISRPGPQIDAVISDIEMPRMDGLFLCKNIKQNPNLKNVPVVLFSSLISQDNMKKGEQVGANVQMPKPELEAMVRLVDKVVSGRPIEPNEYAAANNARLAA